MIAVCQKRVIISHCQSGWLKFFEPFSLCIIKILRIVAWSIKSNDTWYTHFTHIYLILNCHSPPPSLIVIPTKCEIILGSSGSTYRSLLITARNKIIPSHQMSWIVLFVLSSMFTTKRFVHVTNAKFCGWLGALVKVP